MSTLTLERLPESVAALKAMIHEGKTVRLTEKGKTVATVAPAQPEVRGRTRKPKTTFEEFHAKYMKDRPVKADLDTAAFLRAERDR